jgi:HSP20 family protein
MHNLGSMFDNFFDFPAVTGNQTFWPAVDVHETDDELILTMEAPGAKKEDIKVTVRDRILSIEGKREMKHEEKNGTCLVSEIRSGSFARSFTLPKTVNVEKIKADFANGLLTVSLAKLEEIKPKEIEVSVK